MLPECPDMVEFTLECGFATVMAFNRLGTLLAVGTNSGRIVMYVQCARVDPAAVKTSIITYTTIFV